MRVDELLERSARAHPNKTALVCGEQRFTYADVDDAANRAALAFIDAGVARGDRVAICLDNGAPAVAAIFGALKAGATAMPIHASTKAGKLAALLADAEAAALVVSETKLAQLGDAIANAPSLRAISSESIATGAARGDGAHATFAKRHIDVDLALLLYTSGSTGTPKGVMHTHLGIASVTSSIASYLELGENDVVAQVLPLSFGYGLTQLFTTFACGATLVLEKSFAFPQAVLATMAKERATVFAMVPTIAAILARSDFSTHDLSTLRTLTSAGAALPVATMNALRAKLSPHTRVVPMYGQTECIRASYLPPDELERRPDSVGRGLPNQELWLVDDTGARVFGAGEGELVVRGANVMRGYWRQPELTAEKLRAGPIAGERVLHTGDLFRVDNDGFFYFLARKDDVIKTRGEKVSPREVEDALAAHPAVIEAAVVGVPDEVLGQAVHAFVVTANDVDERELLRFCAERLEDFAVPKRVFRRATLPKNDNGKIDKRALT